MSQYKHDYKPQLLELIQDIREDAIHCVLRILETGDNIRVYLDDMPMSEQTLQRIRDLRAQLHPHEENANAR